MTTTRSRAACLLLATALTMLPLAEAAAQHRGFHGGGYRGGHGYHGGDYRGGNGYRGGGGGAFVGGALLGLGVGAALGGTVARPYYAPPPVYYPPPPPAVYAAPPGVYYPY